MVQKRSQRNAVCGTKLIILLVAGSSVQQTGNMRATLEPDGQLLSIREKGHEFIQQGHIQNKENTSQELDEESSPIKGFQWIEYMDKSFKRIQPNESTAQDRITVRFPGGAYPYTSYLKRPDVICFDFDDTLEYKHIGRKWSDEWRGTAEKLFKLCSQYNIKLFIISAGTLREDIELALGDLKDSYFKFSAEDWAIDETRKKDLSADRWKGISEEIKDLRYYTPTKVNKSVMFKGYGNRASAKDEEPEVEREYRIFGSEDKMVVDKSDFVNQWWPVLPPKGRKPVVMMVDDAMPNGKQTTFDEDHSMEFFKQNAKEETMTMSYHFKPSAVIFEKPSKNATITGAEMLAKFLKLPFGQMAGKKWRYMTSATQPVEATKTPQDW